MPEVSTPLLGGCELRHSFTSSAFFSFTTRPGARLVPLTFTFLRDRFAANSEKYEDSYLSLNLPRSFAFRLCFVEDLHPQTLRPTFIFVFSFSQKAIAAMDLANTLIRSVVRAFYETRHILVVDALFIHSVYDTLE